MDNIFVDLVSKFSRKLEEGGYFFGGHGCFAEIL